MGLLIDLLEQPRPCIPAKLVRYATAAPKFFFQRMSLEIPCSLKTGPVRHFKRAGKRLVGFKPLSTHDMSKAEAVLIRTQVKFK